MSLVWLGQGSNSWRPAWKAGWRNAIMKHLFIDWLIEGAGCSSGGRALTCKGWDHMIEPAWRVHLQFGLFSVLTSGPQVVHQSAYKKFACCLLERVAYVTTGGFLLKKYFTMNICLMSNSRWYKKSICSRGVIKSNKLSFDWLIDWPCGQKRL